MTLSAIPTSWFLLLGAILFTIGAIGVLVRRNVLVMLMSVEMMLNAVNLTFVVGGVFCTPYIVMHSWPTDEKDAKGNVKRGTQDNFWTGMASGIIGFTVEPDRKVFQDRNPGSTWTANPDTNAAIKENRAQRMLTPKGGTTPVANEKERVRHFIIQKIDGTTATSEKNDSYPIKEASIPQPNGQPRVEKYADVGYGDAGIGTAR